jgi:N-methylhydantoinase A
LDTRIGVDVGGTFTDLILFDEETSEVRFGKAPSAPAAPETGVLAVVESAVPADVLRRSAWFLHGTTVGLNALLQRSGAVVGLLATEGFRDVIEVRRGDRDEMYNLFWAPPPPLVPRRLRLPVRERVRATGEVHRALVAEDVTAAVETFRAEGVESIAVAFMNAWANPAHELEAERLLREAGFEGDISLSHQVSGEYREYERTCTTIVDAFVRRRMGPYLERLDQRLRGLGFDGEALVTRSGGGAMTFAQAGERPFETILSGPVAGAQGAAILARELGLEQAIAADVGGTSFDTCLITDGEAPVLYEGNVIGLPLQTPWVDVRSIGAGGGSIAYVDAGGLLRVGPRSAGAEPGPACYGRGGTEPTVTDAAVVLGLLPDEIAGRVHLDRDRAVSALEPLAGALGMDVDEAARGVLRIANAAMADAIREITIEQGRDPREAALVAFGGAGPLFAPLLASELGVRRIVVPPNAGIFSAWGLLSSDLTRTASRTRILPLDADGLAAADQGLGELFAGLGEATRREVRLDLRYVGQEHSLTLTCPSQDGRLDVDPDALRDLFEEAYERTFAHLMDEKVEVVCLRAAAVRPLPRPGEGRPAASDLAPPDSVEAWSFAREERLPFAVVARDSLAEGAGLEGPAIVVEPTATTYLDAGLRATVHAAGSLLIEEAR